MRGDAHGMVRNAPEKEIGDRGGGRKRGRRRRRRSGEASGMERCTPRGEENDTNGMDREARMAAESGEEDLRR